MIALLCPVCGTNIGATILFVEILEDTTFSTSARVLADPRILKAAICKPHSMPHFCLPTVS